MAQGSRMGRGADSGACSSGARAAEPAASAGAAAGHGSAATGQPPPGCAAASHPDGADAAAGERPHHGAEPSPAARRQHPAGSGNARRVHHRQGRHALGSLPEVPQQSLVLAQDLEPEPEHREPALDLPGQQAPHRARRGRRPGPGAGPGRGAGHRRRGAERAGRDAAGSFMGDLGDHVRHARPRGGQEEQPRDARGAEFRQRERQARLLAAAGPERAHERAGDAGRDARRWHARSLVRGEADALHLRHGVRPVQA